MYWFYYVNFFVYNLKNICIESGALLSDATICEHLHFICFCLKKYEANQWNSFNLTRIVSTCNAIDIVTSLYRLSNGRYDSYRANAFPYRNGHSVSNRMYNDITQS